MENVKLCGARRVRPYVNGCYSSISLYFIENWYNSAVVVVKYDPMFCTHVMLCAASAKMSSSN